MATRKAAAYTSRLQITGKTSYIRKAQQLSQDPRVKRAGVLAARAAAGTVAAGAGLALGLREAKRTLRAAEPIDLWAEAAVDIRRRPDAKAEGQRWRRRVEELMPKVGGTAADFQAMASRLHPVELELQELEERLCSSKAASKDEEEAALVARWRDAGMVGSSSASQSIFGRRLTSDAQGVDIGVKVPPYLVPEADAVSVQTPSWTGESREAAESALHRWGCTLLRGAVELEDVEKLRHGFGLGQGTSARRAGEVGVWMQQRDPNVAMGRYTFGRLHCLLRGSPVFEAPAVSVHAAVAPLVHAYFRQEQAAGRRAFLSEAQLVLAEPLADAQAWHIDRAGDPGLTVLVPLVNMSLTQGCQQVLPGTHCLSDRSLSLRERWRRSLGALCLTHGPTSPVAPAENATAGGPEVWRAGDAMVVDARLIRCGLANEGMGAPVPLLILRYDLTDAPAPGCSRYRLLMATRLGQVLNSVFRLYSVV